MSKLPKELQTFLQSSKTEMYRHGDKNRASPAMRILKHMATGLALTAGVGCSNISQVSQQDFADMTDKIEDTVAHQHDHKIHLLSLREFDRYKNMHLTLENSRKFQEEVEKKTNAKMPSKELATVTYSSFYNGMPVALSLTGNISKEKECLVIPMDNNSTAEVINHFLPKGAKQYRSAFEQTDHATFNKIVNYHEAWHCSFFANLETYKEKHKVPEKDDFIPIAINHYVTHIGEVLSDIAAIAEVAHDKSTNNTDTLKDFAHMRNLYISEGYNITSRLDTPATVYYSSPGINAMIDFIEEKGLKNFQKMSNTDVTEKILEIAEENTLSYKNFKAMWAYTADPAYMAEQILAQRIKDKEISKEEVQTIEGFKERLNTSIKYAQSKQQTQAAQPTTLARSID